MSHTLTSTNKLKLSELHSAYMSNECSPGFMQHDPWHCSALLKKFNDFREELGLDLHTAEILCHQVNLNYYTILLNAIENEGYTNKHIEKFGDKEFTQLRRDAIREIEARV